MKNRLFKQSITTTSAITYVAALLISAIFSASCTNMKRATYFYGTSDSTYLNTSTESLEPVLHENDLLSISVSSVNPEASEMFNVSNTMATESSTLSGARSSASGYLIDQDGFIRFPVLGKIKASGMTKKALREKITNELQSQKLLIDPIVDVRYLNFKVSVLGEVKNPSVLTIPNEKISLLEALGLAGDITIYGNKENVALLREEDGVKKLRRIDLTSSELFASPYYYLKSNDIIYVEPTQAKVAESSLIKSWIPVVLSAISLAIITVVNFK
ncbi:MAG: polysaccharide biosynthesis/export family protein [Pricia sp.]